MTTLTVPSHPEEDPSLRPLPWRRMAWVTWRQHRMALAGVVIFLGALALGLWKAGLQLHQAYAAAVACHPASSPICDQLQGRFSGMYELLVNGYVLEAVPALIGAFAGAPVLARELETGTLRYAWTQSFGRWRWALAKLVPLAIVVAAAAGAVSVLFSWYYQPYFAARNAALFLPEASPLGDGLFGVRGIAFAAWALAAFAIGALAGLLIRRVVPAMAATLAVYGGLALASGLYLRREYLTPLVTSNIAFNASPPGSAWILNQWWTKRGTTVSQSTMHQIIGPMFYRTLPAVHHAAGKGSDVKAQKGQTNLDILHYLYRHGYTMWTSYQPGSRFWSFQWIEAGWLFALSVALIAATVWVVRRRPA
jgi:ABC-2 family transporter protein